MNRYKSIAAIAIVSAFLVSCVSSPPWTQPFPPGFQPLYPPQAGWAVGSVVLQSGSQVDYWGAVEGDFDLQRAAPDRSYTSAQVGSLSANTLFPKVLRLELLAKGARDYTVTMRGCSVIDLDIDKYGDAFDLKLADRISDKLGSRLEDGQVHYVVSGLTAKTLDYELRTETGAKLSLEQEELTKAIAKANLSAELSATSSGTLVYRGKEPLWVAFKLRPIDAGGNLQSADGPSISPGATYGPNHRKAGS